MELTTLDFENNSYLEKSIIEDAQSIKYGNYSSSKYFALSYDSEGVSKQAVIKFLIKNIIWKIKQAKRRLTL